MTLIKNFEPTYQHNNVEFVKSREVYSADYLNRKDYIVTNAWGYKTRRNIYGSCFVLEFITLKDVNRNEYFQLVHISSTAATRGIQGDYISYETISQTRMAEIARRSESKVTHVRWY